MRIRFRCLMIAGAVAAVLGTPVAAADDNQACSNTGGDTVCSTPGNVQINDSPPVDFTLPYWDETFGGAYPGPYPVPYGEGSGDLGGGRR
ncbi:MAG TPA: hypothetical protein VNW96_21280 [Mycobacterium sp.]|jgi:hypothetical protein|nr:hypothetical protein [Mycobacterium sp.]